MARSPSVSVDVRPLRLMAHALPVLILVQAFLAGRALFGGWSITVHGVLGNVTFVFALVTLVLARLARQRSATVIAAVLVGLLTAQIGLGYSGRESLEAASWHVPLGVTIFGLAVYLMTRLPRP